MPALPVGSPLQPSVGRPSGLSAGRQNHPGGSNSNNAESTWQHWFSDAAREKTGNEGEEARGAALEMSGRCPARLRLSLIEPIFIDDFQTSEK